MRTERDFLGTMEIDDGALYGIHALRARENFPDATPFPLAWYRALGLTKLACYLTYQRFKAELEKQHDVERLHLPVITDEVIEALVASAREVADGRHFEHFIVPAISGGAGTSINMNVNEILANASLQKLGRRPGQYEVVDPIDHANVFQSTNDVIPTSLRVAAMTLCRELEERINALRRGVERLEGAHRESLRIAYTQMQAAVPSSYGKLFGTYSEALSRDWWRTSKCQERLKVVPLGGSAVGTGIAVPRFFIMHAVGVLAELSGLPVARGEHLPDAIANLDAIVEAHAILKAHAVNLEKMTSDLRLLASDVCGRRELAIPRRQLGSSIMPAKVNPVIPEFAVSACHRVYANDALIAGLAGQGCLDLNAYLPAIGHALLESLSLLAACDATIAAHLLAGLEIRSEGALEALYRSPATATALLPAVGYHGAERIAREMQERGCSIFEANATLKLLEEARLRQLLQPQALLQLGYSVKDVMEHES